MTRPTVSVVIPTYNRRSIVHEAIDCALNQTYPPLEVVVADDGSTDGTAPELRRRYADQPQVRVLELPHVNQSGARNEGIRAARGDLVALLDSDDYWYPGYLESQVAVLTERNADMVINNGRRQFQDGSTHLLFEHPTWVVPDRVETLWQGSWLQPSFFVYRTAVARAIPFNETLSKAEDVELMFRLLDAGHTCVGNPATQAEYRAATGHGVKTAEQITVDNDGMLMALYRVWQMHADRHPEALDQRPMFDREFGELLLRNKHFGDARRHFWRLWRRRPTDRDAAVKLMLALLRRPDPASSPAPESGLRWRPEHPE